MKIAIFTTDDTYEGMECRTRIALLSLQIAKYYKPDRFIVANRSTFFDEYFALSYVNEQTKNLPFEITFNLSDKNYEKIVSECDLVIFYLDEAEGNFKRLNRVFDYAKAINKPYIDLFDLYILEGDIKFPKLG